MEFYIMNVENANYAKAYEADNNDVYEYATCSGCETPDAKRMKRSYKVYFKGKKEGDYYSAIECEIVSDSLLEVLRSEAVTGFEVLNIICTKWVDQRGKVIVGKDASKYQELLITGRAGYLKHINGDDVTRGCEICGYTELYGTRGMKEVKGLMLDENEWDGSDMFYFKNWPGNLIVTERVKNIIQAGKFKNIVFCNIKDYQSKS